MRTLYIGKTWPEPASTAAGRRTLDILTTLQRAGEVHFASAANPTAFSLSLDDTGITAHQIQLNDDGFDVWLAALAPDCVVFERFMTEEQFGWRVSNVSPQAMRLLDTSDLHCLREAREQQIKQADHDPDRAPTVPDLFNDIALRELAAIMRCDLTLLISPVETQLLRKTFGVSSELLHTTSFMLTPLPAADTLRGFAERQHLLLLGNFHHAPNRDAARWLRERWPQWRGRFPTGTEVHVYGSYGDHAIQQLHRPDIGFRIKGRADDAVATMSRYRINLAWLRFGAGIKGKIADAWLAGTPSVASPIAAEGMHGELDWGSTVSDDPDVWINEVVRLYTASEDWQAAVDQAQHIAATQHHTEQQQQALLTRLAALQSDLATHRHQHFWGRLLQQQQFRASEYFSRWITEKNQPR